MADFHLNYVPTFTALADEDPDAMVEELRQEAARIRIGIIIPALYSDLASSAMAGIIQVLQRMDFIHKVYISLDRADESQFYQAQKIVAPLGDKCTLLWNDAPRVQEVMQNINEILPLGSRGKGRAVWTALGYAIAKKEVSVLAFHDADILTYNAAFLVRLLFPVVVLKYQFSKAMYARYSDKLHGRVVRLFYFPFVRSLRMILGNIDFLDYMADFRYPLSGEFATYTSLAQEMRYPSDWGIEVGILSEIYRLVRVNRICQVEITSRYDHKHQEVGATNDEGLRKMVSDIARTFFSQLSSNGHILTDNFIRTLKHTYINNARNFAGVYAGYAEMNQLSKFDLHKEISLIETFAETFEDAFVRYQEHLSGSPLMPYWRRVEFALDGVMDQLVQTLENPIDYEE